MHIYALSITSMCIELSVIEKQCLIIVYCFVVQKNRPPLCIREWT